MAELITIARPYAEALFRLAEEQEAYQAWSEVLAVLTYAAKDQRLTDIVNHPKLTQQAIKHVLIDILGELATKTVQNFIGVILTNRRFILLPLIAEVFEAMRAQHKGMAKAHVETAFAINNSEVAELTTWLKKHFKQDIDATVEVNPELIGGIRVTVGNQVIDASIRGKLSSLAATLKS